MQQRINGIDYAIETSGSGDRQALLLHYFAGEGATWREVMGRVPNIRCFAPSLPGFGATAAPDQAYTVDQYAADLIELIAALGLNDFALVGHSMGGKIALAVAALQPAGMRELILVAPSPPTPEPMTEAARKQFLATYGDRAAISQHIDKVVGLNLAENLRAQAVDENLRASKLAWNWWLQHGSKEDISAQIGSISQPVTILGGELDGAIAPEVIPAQVTPYLSGTTARVSILPAVGHLLPYEAPQAIADALTDEREA